MKKQILYLAGIAAIFASCSREAIEAPEETQGPRHIRIQASVEDTRTSLSIDGTTGTYSWQPMETIAVMEENGSEPCAFEVSDPEKGYFDGEATNPLIGAVSPSTALGMYADEEFILSLSGEYDYADGTNAVMVAGAPKVVNGPEGDMQKFTFKHAAGLVMITYENLPFGTKGVRFTTNKPIVGDWEFNSFENVVLNGPTTGSSTAYVMFGEPIGNDELNQPFSFYIPVPVNNYTGIEIALVDNAKNDIAGTKKKMASKAFSVACGDVIKLPTVTLTPAEVQDAGYVKVTSTDDLAGGQYLIVYEEGSVAFNGGLETLDAVGNTIEVVLNDNTIEITEDTEAAEFTFALSDDAWTIKSASGLYIGKTAGGNGLDAKTSVLTNTIEFNNSNVVVTASGGSVLRFNDASNQNRFRYYGSGQKAIQLYKKVEGGPIGGKTAVELSFNPAGPFTVNSSEAESFVAPQLVNPSNVPVIYSLVGGNDGVEIDPATGELTFVNGLDACNLTITASFAGSSVYEAAEASYEISVVAPLTSIAALKALIPTDGSDYEFTMNLTNAVVTSVSTQTTSGGSTVTRIFMQDGSAGILLFNTGADLAVKDVLNGVVTGTAVFYNNNTQYEITAIDISGADKTTQQTVPCSDMTIEEILEFGMEIESMRVKVSMAEAVKSGTKIYLTQGDNSIQYYDPLKSKTLQGGELVNVTGYYTKYGTTDELVVYSADDVEIVAKPVITLTNVPTSALTPAEQDITVNYSVANPISGAVVTASTEADWLEAEAENGEIYIMVGSNDGETVYSAERTGVVTVSYPYTADQTITITQSGNSFAITYATVQGGTLSGPARAKVNQEVTLVATPASDSYTFDNNWTVTPALAGVTEPTVANNKFTMPASDVTVEGSFTKIGGGSYTITFKSGGNGDGSTVSTSTACSAIVSDGSSYLSGNVASASNVYYGGSDGLKLGKSGGAGVIKMNLASSVTPTSIVVKAKRYNENKAVNLSVNGSATQSVSTGTFEVYTFSITSQISYLQLNSSQYCWIESVTVNY